jgi:NADPH:quinone reductase-like Zn-dependent oxidoreductase
MVRSLGANRVIDYTQEDFTESGHRYDLILDCVGNHSLLACKRVLNPKGICVVVTGPDGLWLGPVARMLNALLLSPFVSQDFVPFIAKPGKEDLAMFLELMETGKMTPVIDRRYRLSDVPEAMRYLEEGHARGKVIITLDD